MADDVTLPGSGAVIATDDVSGRQVQLVKPVFGADGSATMVSGANPLPVIQPTYQVLTGTASSVAVTIAQFDVTGYTSIVVNATGTFSGSIRLEGSLDGSTWTVANVGVVSSGMPMNNLGGTTAIFGAGTWMAGITYRYYRINCTSYTSGSLSVAVGLNSAPLHTIHANVINTSLAVGAGGSFLTPTDAFSNTSGAWASVLSLGGGFNGTSWDRHRLPKIFKSITTQASGDTAVWTPTSGKRWQLLKFQLFATADAAQSSGGVITVTLRDVTTSTGLAIPVYVPTTGGTALGGWSSGWIDVGPYGVRAAAINTNLNVNLSAALTAGAIGVIACGTEE